jgi:hypothetical protein
MRDLRFPKCKHAEETDRASVVKCSLNKYGGLPHVGTCAKCSHIGTPVQKSEKQPIKKATKKPCSHKECRMGKMECSSYWSCRDKCRISEKRITEMIECPKKVQDEKLD